MLVKYHFLKDFITQGRKTDASIYIANIRSIKTVKIKQNNSIISIVFLISDLSMSSVSRCVSNGKPMVLSRTLDTLNSLKIWLTLLLHTNYENAKSKKKNVAGPSDSKWHRFHIQA